MRILLLAALLGGCSLYYGDNQDQAGPDAGIDSATAPDAPEAYHPCCRYLPNIEYVRECVRPTQPGPGCLTITCQGGVKVDTCGIDLGPRPNVDADGIAAAAP